MSAHLIDGEFQSDKYPTCPRGKVPLSVKDKTAQDLLWEYAQRRRAVDIEFAADLETALRATGFDPSTATTITALRSRIEAMERALKPFAHFAERSAAAFPDDLIITQGTGMARKQLTLGDCRAALRAEG